MPSVREYFDSYLGAWTSESTQGLACVRDFKASPQGSLVVMTAIWAVGAPPYEEVALFGLDEYGRLGFSSRSSDGRQAAGVLQPAPQDAGKLVFIAKVSEGLARFTFSAVDEDTFDLSVDSESALGWNRFMHHRYRRS